MRSALADYGPVEHPITIEEHRRPARRLGTRHVSFPALTSFAIDSKEACIACRVDMEFVQPRARMRSVLNLTTGTSPFQPRSVPEYSNFV